MSRSNASRAHTLTEEIVLTLPMTRCKGLSKAACREGAREQEEKMAKKKEKKNPEKKGRRESKADGG